LCIIICQVDITDNNYGAGKWEDREIAPDWFLYHLTTCSLRSINCELQFIMQNSRVLTTMKIQVAKSVETTTKHQMFNELSSCPMNSATCQLLFIWMIIDIACMQ